MDGLLTLMLDPRDASAIQMESLPVLGVELADQSTKMQLSNIAMCVSFETVSTRSDNTPATIVRTIRWSSTRTRQGLRGGQPPLETAT